MAGAAMLAPGARETRAPVPFDARRDLKAVVELLRLCFADDLDPKDKRWLADLGALTAGSGILGLFARLLPPLHDVFSGYVWYEGDRLVGNVNLLRMRGDDWVIANVATHPEFRRRGIARQLVSVAVARAERRGAARVGLQVRSDNAGAFALYRDMGFRRVSAGCTYEAPLAISGRLQALSPLVVRSWSRGDDEGARRVLLRAGALEGPWPQGPIREALVPTSSMAWLDRRLRGRREHRLIVEVEGAIRGVAVAFEEARAGLHAVELAVDPDWRGVVETPLLDQVLTYLESAARFPVRADVAASERGARAALEARGFTLKRTLDRMVR
jgi:ribosomal protein S18 acetylase RimI-like enzyme